MRTKIVFFITAFMSLLCGFSMVAPACVDLLSGNGDSACRFFVTAAITVAFSSLVLLTTEYQQSPLKPKEMFLTTTFIWIFFCFFSALPFYLSSHHMSFTDSFFESMSGLTTTGATVFSSLDTLPHGLLFWRSLLQWMGGLGIVILAITVLPALRIGGMQFFNTESSAQSDRDRPRVAKIMQSILIYFISLTALCAGCLWLAGMSIFDAVNHAMTSIATGGFSTHDASIAFFKSSAVEWILIFFMFISGLPLILGFLASTRQWNQITQDVQIKTYIQFLVLTSIVLIGVRLAQEDFNYSLLPELIRSSTFSIISIVTSTGFVADNYETWGSFAVIFFLFLLMSGACTGSTSGGIKMFRLTVLIKTTAVRLKNLVQPHGVFIPRYGTRPISDDILISVLVFLGLFTLTSIICALILAGMGMDLITSLSATLSCVANVGPGLGNVIGPTQTFADLPDRVKWVLALAMMMGRLEFISIVVLCFPFLWKKNA